MNVQRKLGSSRSAVSLVLLLAVAAPAFPEAPPAPKSETTSQGLVEAFQKGPITFSAKVVRPREGGAESALPLFRVPVLKFRDRLELEFSGEAFDPRITPAVWSVVVVFLPKTVAPTDQGVVAHRLQRKAGKMTLPPIEAPYDSVPMVFLIPNKNGRKKVLKDLNSHLKDFRTLCSKIAELSAERATADKFLEDLDAIDKNLSPVEYDNALQEFIHTYGTAVSADTQAFFTSSTSNLAKFQFMTQEFRRTNVLVPEASTTSASSAAQAQVTVAAGGGRPISAYVSIFFDVATIIQNLWPGHQFQYLPALARNFHDTSADLYYSDWIHTTGDTLGALMCCPGKWSDLNPPEFELALPRGESLLKKQTLIQAKPKEKGRMPFELFGHDWKLLVTDAQGVSLPPLALKTSPIRNDFVADSERLHEAIHKAGARSVKVRVVGGWGFTSIATPTIEIPTACDPAWSPSAEELADFQIGRGCTFRLPEAWAGVVESLCFRRAALPSKPVKARLKEREDGSVEAHFDFRSDQAGPGTLEILEFGSQRPARSLPLTLGEAAPEIGGISPHHGETQVELKGKRLDNIQALVLGNRRFSLGAKGPEDDDPRTFKADDGKPFEGRAGTRMSVALILKSGARINSAPVLLLPPKPRISEIQILPVAGKGHGVPIACSQAIASTNLPSQINLIAGKGYHLPTDGAFHASLRNADDPGEVRSIPGSKFRVVGNNLKASFQIRPSELLGGRASGRLELQLVDDHGGASEWSPMPATFIDLPIISAVRLQKTGLQLVGPTLDPIETVAPSPDGPWEKASLLIEEGQEILRMSGVPDKGCCYFKVFGWPDLVLRIEVPALPLAPELKPEPPKGAAPTEKGKPS